MRQSPGAYGHTAQPPRAGWLPRERQHLQEVMYEPQLVGSTPHGVSAQVRGKCTGRQAEECPPVYRATTKRNALLELVARERGEHSDRPNPGRRADALHGHGETKKGEYGKDLQGGQAKVKHKGLPPGVLPS